MGRIHSLPIFVANQIAAGEVIERPSSVVKELLENSWDAGATEINIELCAGGLNQIKISDNGVGIDAQDLSLAIAPHATSKMQQLQDLYNLDSMGFRGEALASIAAISRLTLISKTIDHAEAHSLSVEGKTIQHAICARNNGTTVDVVDLFYNVPVRKIFLKNAAQEYLIIMGVVRRFAFAAMHIAINVWHDGKKTLQLPASYDMTSRLLRIKKIVGKNFIEHAITVDASHEDLRLTGFISGSLYQRSVQDQQWIYLNQRMVKDPLLHRALKQAYEGYIYKGRYPACILYYDMPKNAVDVNVHPTKHEVRFQQPRIVHNFFYTTLHGLLANTHSIPKSKESVVTSQYEAIDPAWILLNRSFAIINLTNDMPYLVDLELAAREYFFHTLTSYPLLSRPLLISLEYSINLQQFNYLQALLPTLLQLGIDCILTQSKIQMLTVPQVLPNLDLSCVLLHLTSNYTPETLLHILLADYVWDVAQWDAEKRTSLIFYLSEKVKNGVLFCKKMDELQCREILYAK